MQSHYCRMVVSVALLASVASSAGVRADGPTMERVPVRSRSACEPSAVCLYVDDDAVGGGDGSTWCDAFSHLQDALSAARAPGSLVTAIHVAQGLYKPDQGLGVTPGDREATFELIDGVPLYGGYAGCGAADPDARDPALFETILSGDLLGNDRPDFVYYDENSYHVVFADANGAEFTLDGFTITSGNANGTGGGLDLNRGAAWLNDCVFTMNQGGSGAAVYFGGLTVANVSGVEFRDNRTVNSGGSGGAVYVHEDAHFSNCIFAGCEAGKGGALFGTGNYANIELTGCRFRANVAASGGALRFTYGAQAVIDNCIFYANTASGGGGAISAYQPGGLAVTNSTFVSNKSHVAGATLSLFGSSGQNPPPVEIADSIIRDGDNSIYQNYPTFGITYSNVQGGWPGEGNIDADPLFVPGPDGCFYLSQIAAGQAEDSPCLDAGSALAADLGLDTSTTRSDEVTDIGIVDMGYHYPVTGSTVPVTECPACLLDVDCDDGNTETTDQCVVGVCVHRLPVLYVDDSATGAGDGSTWCDAFNHLQDALAAARAPGSLVTAIHVAQGVYKPDQGVGLTPGSRSLAFGIPEGVPLYGGYAGCGAADPELRDPALFETILSGDLLGNDGPDFTNYSDNSLWIASMWSAYPSIGDFTLDGFTVTAANGRALTIDRGDAVMDACVFRANVGHSVVRVEDGTLRCTGTVFTDNRNRSAGGAVNVFYADADLTDCVFTENHASDSGGAIRCYAGNVVMDNCLFGANTADRGGALSSSGGCEMTARACTFVGNGPRAVGNTAVSSSDLEFTDCIIRDGPDSIVMEGDWAATIITHSDIQGGWPGEGNIDADPLFVPGPDGCFYLSQLAAGQTEDSPCLDAGGALASDLGLDTKTTRTDEVTDAGIVDMGYHYAPTGYTDPVVDCPECLIDEDCDDGDSNSADLCFSGECIHLTSIVFVDADAVGDGDGSSWCDAFVHLQDALSAARASGGIVNQLRVAQGVYKPDRGLEFVPGDTTARFALLDGVPLHGGYAGCGEPDPDLRDPATFETILSGDLYGDDGPDFTHFDENSQVVVTAWSGTDVTIDGFTVKAGRSQGGLYVSGPAANVSECFFYGNKAWSSFGGALTVAGGSTAHVSGSEFRENNANDSGGAVFVYTDSNAHFSQCIFARNQADSGGAIWADGIVDVQGCRFAGNQATSRGGAIAGEYGNVSIDNCMIRANVATNGGALCALVACAMTVMNSTFTANEADIHGNTLWTRDWWNEGPPTVEIADSIIRDGVSSIFINDNSPVTITYSDVQGGWPGDGNIDADPLFVIGPCGSGYLAQTAAGQTIDSPCVDAGSALASDLGLDTTTTRTDEVTDTDVVDMGFHHVVTGPTGDGCPECLIDLDCDDNLYCNGADYCDLGVCMHEGDPCAASALFCDEGLDACVECLTDADCDDAIGCTDDICTEGECANIYVPAQPPLTATDPPDGAIDARQPFNLDGTNPGGWQSIVWSFAEPVASLDVGQFVVTEIGGDGVAPAVVAAESTDNVTYTLTLSEPIETLAWTDVLYPPGCQHTRIGYLPGDVNADGTTDPPDILAVIDAINGVIPRPLHSADVNRDGVIDPSDVLRVIDLLNGAGAYPSFYGAQLP